MNCFLKLFRRKRTPKIQPEPTTVLDQPNLLSTYLDNVILDWRGNDMTAYHWWPMREDNKQGGSPDNNLYAIGGGIDKYDQLFHEKAREYQQTHYFRKNDSNKTDAGWAGFCDCATTLACTRKYPENSVNVHYLGQCVKFYPKDIEHLMIVASRNTTNTSKSLFFGERCNHTELDDQSEPYPTALLETLKNVCSDSIPFALDVDRGVAVWNYPYNEVKVVMTKTCPSQFIHLKPNKEGDCTYYNFIINSSAYPHKNIDIWGWSNKNELVVDEGWFCTKHPDFVWKTYPVVGEWKGNCEINPEINAQHVYEIYMASLCGFNDVYF